MTMAQEVLGLLDLEPVDLDIYRGQNSPSEVGRIYGGQVVAQCLAAAYRSVDDRVCHSLHGYFINGGDPAKPILFKVERVRDGGSFSVRRVVAIQDGRQIFNMSASFQTPEAGLEHRIEMPPGPGPDTLHTDEELRALNGEAPMPRLWPMEVRPVEAPAVGERSPAGPVYAVWFRIPGEIDDSLIANQCALAYASDRTLMQPSMRTHSANWRADGFQVASLDHALWFHRPSRLSEWHYFVQRSESTSGGRGLNRGEIYDRHGLLVASAAQESLLRPPRAR